MVLMAGDAEPQLATSSCKGKPAAGAGQQQTGAERGKKGNFQAWKGKQKDSVGGREIPAAPACTRCCYPSHLSYPFLSLNLHQPNSCPWSEESHWGSGSNFWLMDTTSGLIRSHFWMLLHAILRLEETNGVDRRTSTTWERPPGPPSKAFRLPQEHRSQPTSEDDMACSAEKLGTTALSHHQRIFISSWLLQCAGQFKPLQN